MGAGFYWDPSPGMLYPVRGTVRGHFGGYHTPKVSRYTTISGGTVAGVVTVEADIGMASPCSPMLTRT